MALNKNEKALLNRFFKEIGLYRAWEEYVKMHHNAFRKKHHLQLSNPYDSDRMDDVIGKSHFSSFLRDNYNFDFQPNIVFHFRNYIKTKYPEHINKLKNPDEYKKAVDSYKIINGKYSIKGINYDI